MPEPAAAARAGSKAGGPGGVAAKVKILFLDVDGTLTDGIIGFSKDGDLRHFWVRDGLALEWARDLGLLPVVISGRSSEAVEARMRDLKLENYLGVKDKVAVAEKVLARERANWDECAMVGDDLPDVAMLRRVGWPIAVADASEELHRFAHTITRHRAGFGAVREVVEMLLRHNGVWDQVLKRYEVLP
ncbi:MAG TPA: HAD hydrolase family protein [Candidatus Sulfotelmatobacter sp.]|nr:HAD hydrolase family protein [Candidatus Sulfotelmatobacter sp.]